MLPALASIVTAYCLVRLLALPFAVQHKIARVVVAVACAAAGAFIVYNWDAIQSAARVEGRIQDVMANPNAE